MRYFLNAVLFILLTSCEQPPEAIKGASDSVINEWKKAKKGDLRAQYNLARRFEKGDGVQKNLPEAAKWFKVIADGEHSPDEYGIASLAQNKLAHMYSNGDGVPMDFSKAERLYTLADKEGTGEGHKSIGLMYHFAGNYEKAITHYKSAASKGLHEASYMLGLLYSGKGYFRVPDVSLDIQAAEFWFEQSSKDGSKYGIRDIADMYHDLKRYPEAIYWYKQALKRDKSPHWFPHGQLAYYHYQGLGTQRDYEKAFVHYVKAAKEGSSYAPMNVAKMLFTGEGVVKDLVKSYAWAIIAMEKDRTATDPNIVDPHGPNRTSPN